MSTTIKPLGVVWAVNVTDNIPISSHCCHAFSSTRLSRFFSARLLKGQSPPALALALAMAHIHFVCSGYPSHIIFSCLASRTAFSSAFMALKTRLIAGCHIWNHPGVLVVASSTPIMFVICWRTRSRYKLQMTSDSLTLKLFDFREQPLVIRQLLESQVVSSC